MKPKAEGSSGPATPWDASALPAAVATRPAPDTITKFDEELVLGFMSEGGGQERLKLGVWDFGGQRNFYSLHLLFLSRIGLNPQP